MGGGGVGEEDVFCCSSSKNKLHKFQGSILFTLSVALGGKGSAIHLPSGVAIS